MLSNVTFYTLRHCSNGIPKSVYLQTWWKKVAYKFWKMLETSTGREMVMAWKLSYCRLIHGTSWSKPMFELPFCWLCSPLKPQTISVLCRWRSCKRKPVQVMAKTDLVTKTWKKVRIKRWRKVKKARRGKEGEREGGRGGERKAGEYIYMYMLAKYNENGAKKLENVRQTRKNLKKLGSLRSINKVKK